MPGRHLSVLVGLLAALVVGLVVVVVLAESTASDVDVDFDALSLAPPLGMQRSASGETEILLPPCIGAVRRVVVATGRRTWSATGSFRGDAMVLGHAPPGLVEQSPYAEPAGRNIDVIVVGGRGIAVAHDVRPDLLQTDTVWFDGSGLTPDEFSRRVSAACESAPSKDDGS